MKNSKNGFNWYGITDNGDGTYTAKSSMEKKRLVKSLHSSGYSVRSKRSSDDGSWSVVAVGTMRQVKRRGAHVGYKPRTRAVRPVGRYVPIGGSYRRRGPASRPMIYRGNNGPVPNPRRQPLLNEAGRPRAPSIYHGYLERKRGEQGQGPHSRQSIEARHKERVEESKKIEADMAARSTGPSTRIRSKDEIMQSGYEQRMMRLNARDEQRQKEPKVDRAALESEREKEITGG